MPELETKLRAAAPRPTHAPAHLEAAIWSALSRDTIDVIDAGGPIQGPELLVDDAPPARRSSRFGLVLGLVAAAAVLVGAVVLAGLRDEASRPAGVTPTTSPPAPPPPAAQATHFYLDDTCPDPSRGACFEPFPAGRYTFHKAFPQVTLQVPAGWRNDRSWPAETVLSRPDTPGAALRILNDAHAARVRGCDVTTVGGVHSASFLMDTVLLHHEGLIA